MTGVSQATVSLVLNGRDTDGVRIAPETRDRVLKVIEETGYVADPIARRLLNQQNRIVGVFTYEPVFPTGGNDFYRPFLMGIEQQAERAGCDLLLLTSAPVVGGRRHIFHKESRVRLADGLILLGRSLDHDDLTRLVSDGPPFVSVGRRNDAGGPVPYVGAAYPDAVAKLVQQAAVLGHQRIAYLGEGGGPESYADRMAGFLDGLRITGVTGSHEPTAARPMANILDSVLDARITAVFAEDHADGVALTMAAEERGVRIPEDLSIVTLGQPGQDSPSIRDYTGLTIPRSQMGAEALELLGTLLAGTAARSAAPGNTTNSIQRLLACDLVDHATLARPSVRVKGN